MTLGFFTPYVEARDDPPGPVVTGSSGSNTTAIDHLRQGVEITSDAYRYDGVLPKFETDDPDHLLDIVVFGQSSEFSIDSKFEELDRFNPVAWITNSGTLAYPVILDNPSFEDPEELGGFIQPLAISIRDLFLSTTELELHDIKGELQDGNADSFRKVNRIVHVFEPYEALQVADLYIDASDRMGVGSGAIDLGGLFPDDERLSKPFDETKYLSRSFFSGSLRSTGSYDIISALVSMSADSSQYVPSGYRTAGTGFTYGDSTFGTDSIAFGGLKRS